MTNKTIIEIDIDEEIANKKIRGLGNRIKREGGDASSSFEANINRSISSLGSLATKAAFASVAVAGVFTGLIGRKAFNAFSSLETIETKFITLLGSVEAAQKQVKQLVDFAARTPFQLDGLANATAKLLAFGVSQDQIISRLKVLGDVAAGSGSDIRNIALIFGQIRAAGRLTGERLLQLEERAIPVVRVLAETLGVAESEIRKLVFAGKIGFGDVEKALVRLTSEGGLFFGATIRQSQTLEGLSSTLKDNIFATFADLGKSFGGLFRGILNTLINLFQNLTQVVRSNADSIAAFSQETLSFLTSIVKFSVNAVGGLINIFTELTKQGTVVRSLASGAFDLFSILLRGADIVAGTLVNSFSAFFNFVLLGFNSLREVVFTIFDTLNSAAQSLGVNLGFDEAIQNQLNAAKENTQIFAELVKEDLTSAFSLDGTEVSFAERIKESLASIRSAAINEETGKSLFDELFSPFSQENTDIAADSFGNFADNISNKAAETAEQMKKFGAQIQKTLEDGIGRSAANAFAAFGGAIATGQNALSAFGTALVQSFGQVLVQLGNAYLALGVTKTVAKDPSGPALIKSGAALAVLGGLLSSVGGTAVRGGGATNPAGIDSTATTPTSDFNTDQDLRDQGPNVSVVVQGDILDNGEDTARRIATLLSDSFDSQGLVVRGR